MKETDILFTKNQKNTLFALKGTNETNIFIFQNHAKSGDIVVNKSGILLT